MTSQAKPSQAKLAWAKTLLCATVFLPGFACGSDKPLESMSEDWTQLIGGSDRSNLEPNSEGWAFLKILAEPNLESMSENWTQLIGRSDKPNLQSTRSGLTQFTGGEHGSGRRLQSTSGNLTRLTGEEYALTARETTQVTRTLTEYALRTALTSLLRTAFTSLMNILHTQLTIYKQLIAEEQARYVRIERLFLWTGAFLESLQSCRIKLSEIPKTRATISDLSDKIENLPTAASAQTLLNCAKNQALLEKRTPCFTAITYPLLDSMRVSNNDASFSLTSNLRWGWVLRLMCATETRTELGLTLNVEQPGLTLNVTWKNISKNYRCDGDFRINQAGQEYAQEEIYRLFACYGIRPKVEAIKACTQTGSNTFNQQLFITVSCEDVQKVMQAYRAAHPADAA